MREGAECKTELQGRDSPVPSVGRGKKIGTHFLRVSLIYISREEGGGNMGEPIQSNVSSLPLKKMLSYQPPFQGPIGAVPIQSSEVNSDSLPRSRNISNQIIQKIYLKTKIVQISTVLSAC